MLRAGRACLWPGPNALPAFGGTGAHPAGWSLYPASLTCRLPPPNYRQFRKQNSSYSSFALRSQELHKQSQFSPNPSFIHANFLNVSSAGCAIPRVHLLTSHDCRGFSQRAVQSSRYNCGGGLLSDLATRRHVGLLSTKSTGGRSSRQASSAAARLVASAPRDVQPYLKLVRMDKPIGTWLLFWPCGWSIALATPAGLLPDPYTMAVFLTGALVMRGAGCTINDMWDRKIDNKVERTRDRPITSGQVSLFDSLVFLAGQLGVGLHILLQLNWNSVLLGASSMGLVVSYPLMKRFTYYPQLVLGLAFNWGALLGWTAVAGECNWHVCLPLYAAGISWTMIYDTIYAHQDKYDDIIVGVKSTAIKFGEQTPACLSCFATTMIGCLVYSGWVCGQTLPYYTAVGAVAAHISHQIYTLDIHNRDDCAKKFVSNRWVGLILFVGTMLGTYLKTEQKEKDPAQVASDVSTVLTEATSAALAPS